MSRNKAIEKIKAHLQMAEMRQGTTDYTPYAETLLKELEPIIFSYAPLPEYIQWALNSGDGVYRP